MRYTKGILLYKISIATVEEQGRGLYVGNTAYV